jgi:hypothetical protein
MKTKHTRCQAAKRRVSVTVARAKSAERNLAKCVKKAFSKRSKVPYKGKTLCKTQLLRLAKLKKLLVVVRAKSKTVCKR